MIKQMTRINGDDLIAHIVQGDYRTAAVFRKYDIAFCCQAGSSLSALCLQRGLNLETIKADLENATRNTPGLNHLKIEEWSLDFLMDYILHMHHAYLKSALPALMDAVRQLSDEHGTRFLYLAEMEAELRLLKKAIDAHLMQEEAVIFSYIRQIEYAYKNKEAYASLLVRTLGKPIEKVMTHNQDVLFQCLIHLRTLSGNYAAPAKSCTTHKVCLALLQELDNDLIQHLHLENDVLFPKAIAMENKLVQL